MYERFNKITLAYDRTAEEKDYQSAFRCAEDFDIYIEEYTQEVIGSIVQNVSIFILSKEGITEAEIQRVETTLFLFVELYADLYSRKYFIECPSNSLSRER